MTTAHDDRLVVELDELDRTQTALAGGKGANLGELRRVAGIDVPAGFCVTTAAFEQVVHRSAAVAGLLDELCAVGRDDGDTLEALGAELRASIDALTLPDDLAASITETMTRLDPEARWAVRSSATTEDLSDASFAGQHDSHLNVPDTAGVLRHVTRCWSSLFSDRAVAYRTQRGIDHRDARMAVVVQRMLCPQTAGVLFTADPVTSNRRIASVEATFGLGEALVTGSVDPDTYVVRGEQVEASVATKAVTIGAAPDGGTCEVPVPAKRQRRATLTDTEVLQLVALGRRVEAHFGAPQDIEWCRVDEQFWFVQSRPITTLFPVPEAGDDANHVYVSVGHQQMMTDPIKPLGLSFWQMTAPTPMAHAGGRLFVDVTDRLSTPATRDAVLAMLGRSDPLIGDALRTVLERDGFVPTAPDDAPAPPPLMGGPPPPLDADPAIVDALIERWRSSNDELRARIGAVSGLELFDLIEADIAELRSLLFDPQSLQVIMAAIDASWWVNDHVADWLGETNVADTLTQSAPHNVTSEMGLALLDVADVIRVHRGVVEHLEQLESTDTALHDTAVFDGLAAVDGGPQARAAIEGFLERYGMRCVGEIDITRSRWSERPALLVPLLLGHIRNHQPGEAARRFDQGARAAAAKADEILDRLASMPDGDANAAETKRRIEVLRTFIGYREYPKYAWMVRFQAYRLALLSELDRLVDAGVLTDVDDAYHLSFDELRDAARTGHVDHELIAMRKEAFGSYSALTPPRVLTSDGEALGGTYRRDDLPAGALAGLGVSAGVVEGRARIAHDMSDARIEPGDILVTTQTDPSWTPLFVSIGGLVTEVGGLMTHGAVVAREYGLPAVVGVQHATQRITDGQWIRLHGTDGFVELDPSAPLQPTP